MSYIEIQYQDASGWLCNNDLLLVCDHDITDNDAATLFMSDEQLRSLYAAQRARKCRRHVPKLNFDDEKLFPSTSNRMARSTIAHVSSDNTHLDDELLSELKSMLDCREYVSKQNNFFDRKQFQQAQAAQAEEERKFEEFRKRQQEQIKIDRRLKRRQHPSYVSRFDEKRYVPSMKKNPTK